AFEELAQGERTAAALENHLTSLERKIEELLARADEDERLRQSRTAGVPSESSNGTGNTKGTAGVISTTGKTATSGS
ncbi:hypothetical protein LTR16_004812, partial [Cryomyces antarcticus]